VAKALLMKNEMNKEIQECEPKAQSKLEEVYRFLSLTPNSSTVF
jgi:hypothetical protein